MRGRKTPEPLYGSAAMIDDLEGIELRGGWLDLSAQRALREEITAAARCEAKVLISGETGVGKEVVARLIHNGGRRRYRCFRFALTKHPRLVRGEAMIEQELVQIDPR